jgi:hypothetical protein
MLLVLPGGNMPSASLLQSSFSSLSKRMGGSDISQNGWLASSAMSNAGLAKHGSARASQSSAFFVASRRRSLGRTHSSVLQSVDSRDISF